MRRLGHYLSGSARDSRGGERNSRRSSPYSRAVGMGAELLRSGQCAVRDSLRRDGRPERSAAGTDADHGLVVGLHRADRLVQDLRADGRRALSVRRGRGGRLSECGGRDLAVVSQAGACAGAGVRVGSEPAGRRAGAAAAGAAGARSRLARHLLGAGRRWAWCGRRSGGHGFATQPEEMPGIRAEELAEIRAGQIARGVAHGGVPWATTVRAAAALADCGRLLLLCVGQLVLLRLVYDLAGARRRVLGRADGGLRLVSVCDGAGRQPGGRRGERAAGRCGYGRRRRIAG